MTTRTVSSTTSTLAWDAMRRLSSVTKNGQTTSFVYDASGQRLLRKDPGSTTLFIDGQELTLQGSAITVNRAYMHAGGTVASRTVTSSTNDLYWMSPDRQASFGLAVRASDGAVSRQRYLPFGAPRGPQNQLPGERGYIGQVEDDGIGLIYLNARYYDAALGRFVSPDPLLVASSPESLNAYAYSGNSPIDRSDPGGALPTDGPALGANCPNAWCPILGTYVELPEGGEGYLREVKQPDGTFNLELCVRGPDAATYTCVGMPAPGDESQPTEVQAAQCGIFCEPFKRVARAYVETVGQKVDWILDNCTLRCADGIVTALSIGAAASCFVGAAAACITLTVASVAASLVLNSPDCVNNPSLSSCIDLLYTGIQVTLYARFGLAVPRYDLGHYL
ncbi:MAG: RHS repeat-associated core domain-containing protein, partial [Dehalococcoidia bacterium]|nr:RHS repeat-associated core domain-containing protein [Dehalococcoidia bacterium]